jgi:hypothetical protein
MVLPSDSGTPLVAPVFSITLREDRFMSAKDDYESDTPELGPNSAGQSGDTQGLSTEENSDSESVIELLEEGQYFEASVLSGIENAPPADVAEVTTKQVPEDDVPEEYLNQD